MNYSDELIGRMNAAKQGHGLDILVNDENCEVRIEVAKRNCSLK